MSVSPFAKRALLACAFASCSTPATRETETESPGAFGAPMSQVSSAGTLTAGAWDDNLNFDFYVKYLEDADASYLPDALTIPRADRVRLRVVDVFGKPIAGARVEVRAGTQKILEAVSGADGVVYAFPQWAGLRRAQALSVVATSGDASVSTVFPADVRSADVFLSSTNAPSVSALDVAVVLDTTESMQDELDWLRDELNALGARVSHDFPGVDQRWSLVTYRDAADAYVTRTTPFSSGIDAVHAALGREVATGGGDYPEALPEALVAMASLDWRGGATARIAFVITDAPYHMGGAGRIEAALKTARQKGIRLYPVAASGLDERGEHTLRSAAQVTGGRYVFLTDDSQVGLAHAEPSVPCFLVTRLEAQLRRAIGSEITGVVEAPSRNEILRTGGDPQDGRCQLPDGEWVVAY